MIITRITGGLGNQLFQYAIGRSLAKKNNDILKLDLSFYSKHNDFKYELNLFNINEHIATEKECIGLRGNEGIFYKIQKKINLPSSRPDFYKKEKQNTIFSEYIYTLKGNVYLDGYWQNEKYFKDIRTYLLNEFMPKFNINKNAKNYLHNIKTTTSIGLHIRRGDYINNAYTNEVHGVCGIDYYKKAIHYLNKKIKHSTYYIFSDDINWCKDNFQFIENKVFVDNTTNALEDLFLMRYCDHNVIANSSFSWWAGWLNENSNKIIISPKIWWNKKPNLHPALDIWKRL